MAEPSERHVEEAREWLHKPAASEDEAEAATPALALCLALVEWRIAHAER